MEKMGTSKTPVCLLMMSSLLVLYVIAEETPEKSEFVCSTWECLDNDHKNCSSFNCTALSHCQYEKDLAWRWSDFYEKVLPCRVQCPLPAMDSRYEDKATVERGHRFGLYSYSRLEYKRLPKRLGQSYLWFRMNFKTYATEGLLFYITHPSPRKPDFMAIYLLNGTVMAQFNNGRGTCVLSSKERYNDGKWHEAFLHKRGFKGILWVDELEVARSRTSGTLVMLNAKPPFYVGGLPNTGVRERARARIGDGVTSFDGCLRDYSMSWVPFKHLKASVGVSPCSSSESGTFFGKDGGYVWFDNMINAENDVDLYMEIRPRKPSGILMMGQDICSSRKLFDLRLLGDQVQFSVLDGAVSVSAQLNSTGVICDGSWHTVQVKKRGQTLELFVDGERRDEMDTGDKGSWANEDQDLSSCTLMVGGYPGEPKFDHFIGCIRNVYANGERKELARGYSHGDVRKDTCPTD